MRIRGRAGPGLLTVFVWCVLVGGPVGASAQNTAKAVLREGGVEPGGTGTAWIEENFGGLFAIESIRINPPDPVFEGRGQRAVVKLLERGDMWTTVMDLPVDPESARDPATEVIHGANPGLRY